MTTKAEVLADLDVIDICLDTADHRLGDKHKARFDRIRDFINSSPEWQPIDEVNGLGTKRLYYSPGKKGAYNQNAEKPHMIVDIFNKTWPRARYQYPEAPYTHSMSLPSPPITGET